MKSSDLKEKLSKIESDVDQLIDQVEKGVTEDSSPSETKGKMELKKYIDSIKTSISGLEHEIYNRYTYTSDGEEGEQLNG